MVSAHELRYILAVATERHFGKAAKSCNVSQPTLSVAVKKIEDRLGVLIFERSNHNVFLTSIGEKLIAQAKIILSETHTFEDIAASAKDQLDGSFRLGAIYTVAPYLLPNLVPSIATIAPNLSLFLQEDFTESLLIKLHNNELDAIVIALPFNEPGISVRQLYSENFQILLPIHHPLCAKENLNQTDLDNENLLLLGKGNCFRDQVVAACPNSEKYSNIKFEASSLETLRLMVASGSGITIVPNSAVQVWFDQDKVTENNQYLSVRPFATIPPERTIVLAWRVSFPRPKVIDVIINAIQTNPPKGVHFFRQKLLFNK